MADSHARESFVSHLLCSLTGERQPADRLSNLSLAGKPLLVRYDLEAARDRMSRAALAGRPGPWTFASAPETERRLRRLGWVDVWVWSHHVRVEPDDPREYLGTVALGSHVEPLDPGLREPFIDAVLAELDEPVLDYVRLNILARRPS